MTSPDDVTEVKRRLRELGWYVRYTEWPSGHQVVLHRRSDTAVHLVTGWWSTEAEAYEEARSMAEEHGAGSESSGRGPGGGLEDQSSG